jgi:hypothetical protein
MRATKAALARGGINHRRTRHGLSRFFLSVVRTSSRLMSGMAANSTTRSASSRTLQRARPFGGAEQANATSRSSWSVDSFGAAPGWGRPRSAVVNPSAAKLARTRATVRALTPHRSATSRSERTRRPGRSSASSRMRAWRWVGVDARPWSSTAWASARCSGVNRI